MLKLTGVAVGAKALVDFGKKAVGVASDLTEVQNVVDVTFGQMSEDVNQFAKNALKSYGLSELSAKKYTSTMGAMLKSSGIAGRQMEEMSKNLTGLSADIASFYNLEDDEAFRKILSGLSGQTQPLKELGINMNVANLEAFNLSQGINKSWQEMSQAEQVLTRYNYLLSVTGDAQGDFSRNTGTWANQTKILKEQWQEFMGLIGNAIIQVLLPFVKALNKILEMVNKVLRKIGELYSAITGKSLATESNSAIADSNDLIADTAGDAADAEKDLSKGIDKAAKAAKRALAPFDELNILQGGLGGGGTGGGGFPGVGGLDSLGGMTADVSNAQSGIKGLKDEFEDLFFMLDSFDKRGFFKEPITVPAPAFEPLPDPVYKPNWGLDLPKIPVPAFPQIPSPIYQPNWGLIPPNIPLPVIPPLPAPIWEPEWNLEVPRVVLPEIPAFPAPVWEPEWNIVATLVPELATSQTAFATWKQYLMTQFGELVTNMSYNAGQLKDAVVQNVTEWTTSTKQSITNWGTIITTIGLATAQNFEYNIGEMLDSTASNISDWISTTSGNAAEWGRSMLATAAETAKGIVRNIANGLETAWANFKSALTAMGEDIKGSFRPRYSISTVEGIGMTASIVGNMFKAMRGNFRPMAAPGLATGAVIPPNNEFLAVLGDQKTGTNIETPERLLRQVVREELSSMAGNGDVTIHNNIELDGEPIFKNVKKIAWEEFSRSGESPFPLFEG